MTLKVGAGGGDGERRRPRRRWWTSTRPTPPRTSCPSRSSRCRSPNRDFQSLAYLAPGVQRERGGNRFIGNQPVIGAAGNASQSTIMIDGVDFTDPTLGMARARFSQEAISEFRVIANRFDTEIGGSAGGALSIVTKSGTNDLHGSAFGFFRDKLAAREGRARPQEERLLAPAVRRHRRRADHEGPRALLRVVRAGQREQLRAVPAGRRLRVAGGRHEGAVRPVTVLRRARHADSRRPEPAVQVRLRALPPGQLPRRRRRGRDRRHEAGPGQLQLDGHARVDARQQLAQPAGDPVRPAQVRRAEQQPRRWPSTSRAAPRSRPARTSSATSSTPGTSSRSATRSTCASAAARGRRT